MKSKRVLHCVGQALRILLLVFLGLVLIGNIYVAVARNFLGRKNPTVFGFTASVVLTGSMSGSIEVNDIVITHRQDSYAVGDVITFDAGGSSATHRIIAADDEGYHTKGDANNTADMMPTEQDAVIGKVILVIPRIGALFGFIRTPLGILCFLGLTVLIVELPSIAARLKKRGDVQ